MGVGNGGNGNVENLVKDGTQTRIGFYYEASQYSDYVRLAMIENELKVKFGSLG